jgi:hypothetical protein
MPVERFTCGIPRLFARVDEQMGLYTSCARHYNPSAFERESEPCRAERRSPGARRGRRWQERRLWEPVLSFLPQGLPREGRGAGFLGEPAHRSSNVTLRRFARPESPSDTSAFRARNVRLRLASGGAPGAALGRFRSCGVAGGGRCFFDFPGTGKEADRRSRVI